MAEHSPSSPELLDRLIDPPGFAFFQTRTTVELRSCSASGRARCSFSNGPRCCWSFAGDGRGAGRDRSVSRGPTPLRAGDGLAGAVRAGRAWSSPVPTHQSGAAARSSSASRLLAGLSASPLSAAGSPASPRTPSLLRVPRHISTHTYADRLRELDTPGRAVLCSPAQSVHQTRGAPDGMRFWSDSRLLGIELARTENRSGNGSRV